MKTFTGQCHCKLNTITITAEPEFQFTCYCNNCRVINSGGHLCGIIFDESNFTKAKHAQSYSYSGSSGKPIILHFCSKCGTHLYAYPTAHEGKVAIRANILEELPFQSQHSLFTESAFGWDKTK
jgi:hypothetical protein